MFELYQARVKLSSTGRSWSGEDVTCSMHVKNATEQLGHTVAVYSLANCSTKGRTNNLHKYNTNQVGKPGKTITSSDNLNSSLIIVSRTLSNG